MRSQLKLLSFILLFTVTSARFAQAQVEAKPPAILPGQSVGNQVVITTAGSVVGSGDSIPRVPTDSSTKDSSTGVQLPQGVIVDARKDYLDAAPSRRQNSQPSTEHSTIKLPSLPIDPIVE